MEHLYESPPLLHQLFQREELTLKTICWEMVTVGYNPLGLLLVIDPRRAKSHDQPLCPKDRLAKRLVGCRDLL